MNEVSGRNKWRELRIPTREDPIRRAQVEELVERARAAGRLREDVGRGDVAMILSMVGGLMEASVGVAPELWRRYLAMVLEGLRHREGQDGLPGGSPEWPEVERILAGWVPPRRPNDGPLAFHDRESFDCINGTVTSRRAG